MRNELIKLAQKRLVILRDNIKYDSTEALINEYKRIETILKYLQCKKVNQ